MEQQTRLQNFPITWFAVVMGLTGFSIAWHRAETLLSLPLHISPYLLGCAAAVFGVLLLSYGLKLVRHPDKVRAEFAHPVKLNFFPTVSISMILLSIALLQTQSGISFMLWAIGSTLHLIFTLYILSAWIHHTHFEIQHINPAWFIPIVGNIMVPIAGVHHASPEIAWFFFSIGLLFWMVLLTIILYRTVFHQPLPAKLLPTLFILIAPPALGFISWLQLADGVGAFGRILYYSAIFLTLMLLTQAARFVRLKFFLSWWAYSFPMAAITIATLLMFQHTQLAFFSALSLVLLALLSLLVITLLIKTLQAMKRKEICVEE